MADNILYIVLFVICVVLSGFFCSSETAFFALQRFRLESLVQNESKGAKLVSRMLEKPERLLSIVLLGTNFVNTAAASLGTILVVSFWGQENGVIISTVLVTIILLIFAETTPKTIAAHHPERLSMLFARPLNALAWLLSPFVFVLSWVANRFNRLVGGTTLPRSIASEEEIRIMISTGQKEGTMEPGEAKMLHRVFEFGDRPVFEVMVPRPEVIAIEQGSKASDLLKLYTEHPISRFPVYRENMDNVVGIVAVKDVLMSLAKGAVKDDSLVDELVRPAYFTPETKKVGELFVEMKEKNYRMAVVVDEYGGTAGVVSLTRLVEEIVGPVGDEMAGVEKDYEVINEHTFQIDGSMRIEDANKELKLGLLEGEDYETVAGLILSLLGHIPRQGEQLKYQDMKMVITRMRGVKIEEILLTREKRDKEEDAADTHQV